MKLIQFAGPVWKGSLDAIVAGENLHDGAYVIDPTFSLPTHQVVGRCRAQKKPFVIGCRYTGPKQLTRIRKLFGENARVALGTSPEHEWSPGVKFSVPQWVEICEDAGLIWCCPYIQVRLLEDLHRFEIRDQLAEYSVPVYCLCGYMLARYAMGQSVPTYWTAMWRTDLRKKHGLTVEALQEWLEPLEAYSGAGSAKGLDRGTMQTCEAVGFDGVVCTPPFPTSNKWNEGGAYKELVDPTWT